MITLLYTRLQEAEVSLRNSLRLAPAYSDSVLALARLLATTTAAGRRLQEGHFGKGKRLEEVRVCCWVGGGGMLSGDVLVRGCAGEGGCVGWRMQGVTGVTPSLSELKII